MSSELEREEELTAADWRHMYCILLRGIDAALERLPNAPLAARSALEASVEEAEEAYVTAAGIEN